MGSMVAARVPEEIRLQGNAVLKKIGSSPSELINAAYDYVLKCGKLPDAHDLPEQQDGAARVASPELISHLEKQYLEMSVPVDGAWDGMPYKQIRDSLQEERYARFA